MEKIVLQQTSDLSIFEMNDVNRVIVDENGFVARKDLIASMKSEGFRPAQPISCVRLPGGRLRIFDGHNRFVVAKLLGIPVFYMAYPKAHAVTPLAYSTGQKAWTFREKAAAISHDNADFAEVLAYSKRTGIPAQAAFSMFAGQLASSNNVYKNASLGDYKIVDRDAPEKVAKIVAALQEQCSFGARINLVFAVSKAIHAQGFSVSRMVERIGKHPELLEQRRSADDYIDLLELIYNRNTKGEKLYLKVEVEKAVKLRSVCGKP